MGGGGGGLGRASEVEEAVGEPRSAKVGGDAPVHQRSQVHTRPPDASIRRLNTASWCPRDLVVGRPGRPAELERRNSGGTKRAHSRARWEGRGRVGREPQLQRQRCESPHLRGLRRCRARSAGWDTIRPTVPPVGREGGCAGCRGVSQRMRGAAPALERGARKRPSCTVGMHGSTCLFTSPRGSVGAGLAGGKDDQVWLTLRSVDR